MPCAFTNRPRMRGIIGKAGSIDVANSQVKTYRAIPYAVAERFAPPRAVPFDESLIAGERGPICPQLPSRLEPINGPQPALRQDENCQVLTVSTTSRLGRRPVIVWLHGGAYVSGGGELPWYDGDALVAEHDLVFVSVTYRLGAFGYLRLPGAEGPSNGHADQIEALRWVQANIWRFGGDPDRVTVAGQSAGAHAIQALLDWGHGGELFHRAIAHSPTVMALLDGRGASKLHRTFVAALSADPADASPEMVLEAQAAVLRELGGGMPFRPAAPERTVAGGRVDVLTTWTPQDAGFFVLKGRDPAWLDTFRGRIVAGLATRAVFWKGCVRLVRAARRSGGDTELLRIDWNSGSRPWHACHCVELPLLFGTGGAWSRAPMLKHVSRPDLRTTGAAMRRLWANVACRERFDGWADEEILATARLSRQG